SQANRKKVAGRRQDSGVTRPLRQPQLVRPYQAKPARKMPPVNRASRARAAGASVRRKRRTSRIHAPPIPLTSARKKPGGQGLERRRIMGHPVPVNAGFELLGGCRGILRARCGGGWFLFSRPCGVDGKKAFALKPYARAGSLVSIQFSTHPPSQGPPSVCH